MDGIIFDLDGTLWDSTEVVAASWNDAISQKTNLKKRVTAAELKAQFGKPLEEILMNVFPTLDEKGKDELAIYLFQYENDRVAKEPCVIYENMVETVKELSAKYKIFIVSNCEAGYIEAFLKNTGLGGWIEDFTCPGDTGMLKGNNIRLIMERNDLVRVVYVGDTQGDANACKQAGVPMIYASYGFGVVDNPYVSIDSLTELLHMDFKNMK